MMEEAADGQLDPESRSTTHIVHGLMQFAVAVRHRKGVVIAAVFVTGVLGALYYVTATRYYDSNATLLVLQSGSETNSAAMEVQGGVGQGLMPTYEKLISRNEVIEEAIEQLRARPADMVDLADVPRERWVAALQRNLSAKTVYATNFIEIKYLSKDPEAAVAVVRAVVASYLNLLDRIHYLTAGEILQQYQGQIDQFEVEIQQRERQLNLARIEAGDIVGVGPDSTVLHPAVERALTLNKELSNARTELTGLRGAVNSIETAARNGEDLQYYFIEIEENLGREMMASALNIDDQGAQLRRKMVENEAERKSLSSHLGPNHPRVRELTDAINTTRERLRSESEQIHATEQGTLLRTMIAAKLANALENERQLELECQRAEQEAANLTGPLAYIRDLEREVNRLYDWQDLLINRMAAIDLSKEGPSIRARLVDSPARALRPASPNLRRVALMALIAGLGIGLAGVYVLDTLDDRFRSVEEMQAHLGVPVMAIVRKLPPVDVAGPDAVQIHAHPDSPESEAFRTLRTALSLTDRESREIVISSTEPGDGKTTVLANLAAAYAQSGKKTLLIDADLRRPGLTAMLGFRGTEGVSSLIRGTGDVAQSAAALVRPSGIEGLDVLPSGPRPSNPAELLASTRFSELLGWAEGVYDQILIDSPPALAASDTALIGRLVDGILLVVQPAKNRRRLVIRATESFTQVKIPLFGVAVNRIGNDGNNGYYEYGADYDGDYEGDYEGDCDCAEDDCPDEFGDSPEVRRVA
jgi:capsular exopolysaccharide synthesis family protein